MNEDSAYTGGQLLLFFLATGTRLVVINDT